MRKKATQLSLLFTLVLSFTLGQNAKAQLGDVGEILRAGAADANILIGEFLSPYAEGFASGLNQGWIRSSKPHSILGFDVTLKFAAAAIPTKSQSFNVSNLNLTELQLSNGVTETATIAGEKGQTSAFTIRRTVNGQTYDIGSFEMPEGTGFPYALTPMVQASIGLPLDIDVSVRYLPETELEGMYINLFGLGFQHKINRWLPGGDFLPIDISITGGFTQLTVGSDLDAPPTSSLSTYSNPTEFTLEDFKGQSIELNASGYTLNAIVGKNLSLLIASIGIYGGFGIESGSLDLNVSGKFPLDVPDPAIGNPNRLKLEANENPVSLNYDSPNSFNFIAGARVKLFLFEVTAQYTKGTYDYLTVGIGVGLR